MNLTIGLKLKPTKGQAVSLLRTLYRANEAANEVSRRAWQSKTFGQFSLHRVTYRMARERFELSAQVVVRMISKVADAYKLDKKHLRVFRKDGSIAYDDRILRYFEKRGLDLDTGRTIANCFCLRQARTKTPGV